MGKKGEPKTGGRVKGTPNKVNREIKEMIRTAIDKVGGVDYLVRQAEENPTAFLSLLKVIIPKEVEVGGKEDNEIVLKIKGLN